MKKIKTNVVAALVFAAMFFSSSCSKETETVNPTGNTSNTYQTAARISGPSVNGQGSLFLEYPGFTPGVQQFSFHANTDRNGKVTGSFEARWADNGRLHGTIDCLSILADGKTAIMSGTVTKVGGATYTAMHFAVGDDTWFKVQENGEGKNATKDSFSDLFAYFDLEPCSYDYNPDLFPILYGNIQVKP